MSVFSTELAPHAHEEELVALVTPPSIMDPEGHGVHPVFSGVPLKALEPHALQPRDATVASPPYPALHSQRKDVVFRTELAAQRHEEELVASLVPVSIMDPEGHDVQATLPILPL